MPYLHCLWWQSQNVQSEASILPGKALFFTEGLVSTCGGWLCSYCMLYISYHSTLYILGVHIIKACLLFVIRWYKRRRISALTHSAFILFNRILFTDRRRVTIRGVSPHRTISGACFFSRSLELLGTWFWFLKWQGGNKCCWFWRCWL